MPKTRYTDAELDEIDQQFAFKIRDTWHKCYNPVTRMWVYNDPQFVQKLRASLEATIPYQPETEMDRIKANKV